jgi:hypothetical protein
MEVNKEDENILLELKYTLESIIEPYKKFLKGYLHIEIMNIKLSSY